MPSSTNGPASTNNGFRSRAVSLPRACCLATFSSPPPARAFARRASRSSTNGRSRDVGLSWSATARSAAFPHGVALFEEGRDALHDVLGGERERELRAQVVERVVERHVH